MIEYLKPFEGSTMTPRCKAWLIRTAIGTRAVRRAWRVLGWYRFFAKSHNGVGQFHTELRFQIRFNRR